MDYEFTQDWLSHNIPSWKQWLAEFKGKPGLCALEIGSFEGRSTTWLLENMLTHESSRIDCNDPFHGNFFDRFLGLAASPYRMATNPDVAVVPRIAEHRRRKAPMDNV